MDALPRVEQAATAHGWTTVRHEVIPGLRKPVMIVVYERGENRIEGVLMQHAVTDDWCWLRGYLITPGARPLPLWGLDQRNHNVIETLTQ